jgi:hypothetical protein
MTGESMEVSLSETIRKKLLENVHLGERLGAKPGEIMHHGS